MTLQTMYPAIANSPVTQLANAIDDTVTSIEVVDGSRLPDAPNLATIGRGENPETILYTKKNGNVLSGITRGFQGTAQNWQAGTQVARLFTAHDFEVFRENILDLKSAHDAHKAENVTDFGGVHGLSIESGSFTPLVEGQTTSGNNTYSIQVGKYYLIGKLCHIDIRIVLTSKDANMSGNIAIAGLPFASKNDGDRRPTMVGRYENFILDTARTKVSTNLGVSTNKITLLNWGDSVIPTPVTANQITSTTAIIISGRYEIQ